MRSRMPMAKVRNGPRYPPMSLLGQLEIHATFTVKLNCDGTIDGVYRRFVQLALQRYEVKGSRRIRIILSQPNLVQVCQFDQIEWPSICLRAGGLARLAVRILVVLVWVRISIRIRIWVRIRCVGIVGVAEVGIPVVRISA